MCADFSLNFTEKLYNNYRPQGEGIVFTGVCLSTIGLPTTDSLLGLLTARSVRILLECFLALFE